MAYVFVICGTSILSNKISLASDYEDLHLATIRTAFKKEFSRAGRRPCRGEAGRTICDGRTRRTVAPHPPAAANKSATTSGTPMVAGLATTSKPAPPTPSGSSRFTTIRRARLGVSNTSPAAG